MLNAKADDSELCLGKYWKKYIGECVILGAIVEVRQKQSTEPGMLH